MNVEKLEQFLKNRITELSFQRIEFENKANDVAAHIKGLNEALDLMDRCQKPTPQPYDK